MQRFSSSRPRSGHGTRSHRLPPRKQQPWHSAARGSNQPLGPGAVAPTCVRRCIPASSRSLSATATASVSAPAIADATHLMDGTGYWHRDGVFPGLLTQFCNRFRQTLVDLISYFLFLPYLGDHSLSFDCIVIPPGVLMMMTTLTLIVIVIVTQRRGAN